jgi:hypothetical protein
LRLAKTRLDRIAIGAASVSICQYHWCGAAGSDDCSVLKYHVGMVSLSEV